MAGERNAEPAPWERAARQSDDAWYSGPQGGRQSSGGYDAGYDAGYDGGYGDGYDADAAPVREQPRRGARGASGSSGSSVPGQGG
ncbi:MAG: hypothetical protein HOV87_25705, partial [Catenulispora sp.]|nr:hypothetical protein [Catenulispora sp.]